MKVISINNRKGGVGKTATAQALGAGLMAQGYSVLFIDLDAQMNLSTALRANTKGLNILGVLLKQCSIYDAIQITKNGHIVPATAELSGIDLILKSVGKEYRLKEALQGLEKRYDFIIIDTAPSLDVLTTNALTASNETIIPIQADLFSLQGVQQLAEIVESIQQYTNKNLTIKGILLTRYKPREIASRNVLSKAEEMAEELHTKVFNTKIRESLSVKEAQIFRESIYEYDSDSNGARDYREFTREYLAEVSE